MIFKNKIKKIKMGCKCNSAIEELEIEKKEKSDLNEDFEIIENEEYIENKNKKEKINQKLKNYLDKNNEIFQTISEKNATINVEENTSKKNTIEIVEKESDSESLEENIIDKTQPQDSFSRYIFSQINLLRENPSSFIELIQNSESNIKNEGNRLIYKTKLKVLLNKGIKAFEEAKLILSNTKPMEKLIYDYNMKLKLPKKEINIKSNEYLKQQIYKKYSKGINIKSYWKEIIYEPETCFVLMIVDDTGKKAGFKRRNLLNPDYKYIAINSKMINNKFVCYIALR